jgi:hypothetical protein
VVQGVRRVYEWAKANASDIAWGSGKANGSFVPRIDHNGYQHRLIIVWTGGYLEFLLSWVKGKPPFGDTAKRLELIRHINEIPGVSIPDSAIDRNPTIPLTVLGDQRAVDALLKALDWAVQEIRST